MFFMNKLVRKLNSKIKSILNPTIKSISKKIRYYIICLSYKLPLGKHRDYDIQGDLIINGHIFIDEFVSITVAKGGKLNLGNNVSIGSFSRIHVGKNNSMEIGEGTSLNSFNILIGDIKIGCNCLLAPYAYVSSGTHQFKSKASIRESDTNYLINNQGIDFSVPIVIADDCWLGISSVVLYGSYIGKGCIIGANSVVPSNRKLEEYGVWGGVPIQYLSHRS